MKNLFVLFALISTITSCSAQRSTKVVKEVPTQSPSDLHTNFVGNDFNIVGPKMERFLQLFVHMKIEENPKLTTMDNDSKVFTESFLKTNNTDPQKRIIVKYYLNSDNAVRDMKLEGNTDYLVELFNKYWYTGYKTEQISGREVITVEDGSDRVTLRMINGVNSEIEVHGTSAAVPKPLVNKPGTELEINKNGLKYMTDENGQCYYMSLNGTKVYVDRNFCK